MERMAPNSSVLKNKIGRRGIGPELLICNCADSFHSFDWLLRDHCARRKNLLSASSMTGVTTL
jgi:hypothetical protein